MRTIIFYSLCVSTLCCMIMASEGPLNRDLDLTYMPPMTMTDIQVNHIKQQVPYLQRLVNDSIDALEKFDYLRQQFNQYEQLDRLKEIKKRLDEVDEHLNPVITQSLEGQFRVLYWLVECSYIHEQLKKHTQNTE